MATPSLRFMDLHQIFLSELEGFKVRAMSIEDQDVQSAALRVLSGIERSYQEKDSLSSKARLEELTQKSFQEADAFVQSLNPKLSDTGAQVFFEEGCRLQKQISEFKEIVFHQQEIDKEGLKVFSSEGWAVDFFAHAIRQGNAQAIQALRESESWAIEMIYSYLESDLDSEEMKEAFIVKILLEAKSSSELQIALGAISIIIERSSGFVSSFIEAAKGFEDLKGVFPSGFLDQVDGVEEAAYEFQDVDASDFEEGEERPLNGYFKWDETSAISRINILRLLIRHEQNLIRVLCKSIDPHEFVDAPVSSCFPKATALYLGAYKTDRGEFTKLFKEVVAICNAHQLPVHCLLHHTEEVQAGGPLEGVQISRSNQVLDKWLQDSSFFQSNQIRYPSYFTDFEGVAAIIFEGRKKRMAELGAALPKKPLFHPMGSLAQGQRQFSFLDAMMQTGLSLDRHSIQFTHNEGGNCLVGEHLGERYVIIGKDALALNRVLLSKKLAEIGLNKSGDGKWVFSRPYAEENCHIDDDDIKYLFALDMGLTSVERLHVIEQPDFHLDTSMMLVHGNKIILNDSMMAYQVFQDFIEEEIDLGKVATSHPKWDVFISKRREVLLERSKVLKLHEDAAAADLEKAGFEVVRVAGKFDNILMPHPSHHRVNFFNSVTFTSHADKKVIIAMGCQSFFQRKFREIVQDIFPKVEEPIFLDLDGSENLARLGGGVHCIVKLSTHE